MPHTIKDKYKLGKQFIDGLDLDFRCHEFHGQYLKCNCICNLTLDQLSCVKTYFSGLLQVFWDNKDHIAKRTDAEEIGICFGYFILPLCSLTSKRPSYTFDMAEGLKLSFCLSTLIKMFGLNQDACTAARAV